MVLGIRTIRIVACASCAAAAALCHAQIHPDDQSRYAAEMYDPDPMIVTGQVTDPQGRAVAGASVLVMTTEYGRSARPSGVFIANSLPYAIRYHGPHKTNENGEFSLDLPHSPAGPYLGAAVYAVAKGHGLATAALDVLAKKQEIDLKLATEHVARGRIIDLKGQPVVGARIRLYHDRTFRPPHDVLDIFSPVTTDDQGRFVIVGLGNDKVHLEIQHDNFASHREEFQPIPRSSEETTSIALSPAHRIVGRVAYADTGKPAAGALVIVPAAEVGDGRWTKTRTDESGNYSVNPFVPDKNAMFSDSETYFVYVFPLDSAHYLVSRHKIPANRAAEQQVDVKLERGVLVRGRVTEEASGRPVAGARIQFSPNQDDMPYSERYLAGPIPPSRLQTAISDEEGQYLLPVPSGKGVLYVLGPTLDYVPIVREADTHREYAAAIVPLDLEEDAAEQPLDIQIKRGVTLTARVVGADGKPVPEFVVVTLSYIRSGYRPQSHGSGSDSENLMGRDGRFELRGCDPRQSHVVVVYDADTRCGATAVLTKANAETPATIRLQPCASGKATMVDKEGNPIANFRPRLSIVLSEGGPDRFYTGFDAKRHTYAMEADLREMEALDWDAYNHRTFITNDKGEVALRVLIPGATHMFDWIGGDPADPAPWPHVTFTVKSGEEKDLGTITHEHYRR